MRQNRTTRPAQNFIKGELQSDKCREASVGEGTVKTRLVRARLQLRDLVAPFTTARGLFNTLPTAVIAPRSWTERGMFSC